MTETQGVRVLVGIHYLPERVRAWLHIVILMVKVHNVKVLVGGMTGVVLLWVRHCNTAMG